MVSPLMLDSMFCTTVCRQSLFMNSIYDSVYDVTYENCIKNGLVVTIFVVFQNRLQMDANFNMILGILTENLV